MQQFGTNHVIFMLMAARWTVVLSLIAFVGGGLGGLLLAIMRVQPGSRVLRGAAAVFIRVFQSTPLLMQLFLFYFGLGFAGFPLDAWTAVSIALTVYASAFLGEIWRGCIEAIPRGQDEASAALALTYAQRLRLVILPQALRIALPPTVGFLVQVVKSTSLAAIIGFAELIRAGQMVSNVTLKPLLVYSVVMAIYFALCWPLSLLSSAMEWRLHRARTHGAEEKLIDPRLQGVAA